MGVIHGIDVGKSNEEIVSNEKLLTEFKKK
jgi:hypothetical protein